MKIKSDFITNSSSISYIVFIPDSFKVSQKEMRDGYEQGCSYYDDEADPITDTDLMEIKDLFESLKNGETLWYYMREGIRGVLYETVLEICDKNKFILNSSEVNGEGNDTTTGIKQEKIQKILMDHLDINKLLNNMNKGEEHVKVKEK